MSGAGDDDVAGAAATDVVTSSDANTTLTRTNILRRIVTSFEDNGS
jgi:hypothetical protein